MLKRVCDKCKKSLENEKYYEINISEVDRDGWRASKKSFDLCENCHKSFLDFLKESK